MPTVVLKLFAGQDTGRTDGRTEDNEATICFHLGKHTIHLITTCKQIRPDLGTVLLTMRKFVRNLTSTLKLT